MLILAMDTCCGPFSLTLRRDDVVIVTLNESEHNKHAELMVRAVDLTLKKFGIIYEDLDIFATTTGPGSFTGIRAGFSFLYAASVMLKSPLLGFTSLEVLGHQLLQNHKINHNIFYVTISAGRDRYYRQLFNSQMNHLDNIKLSSREEIASLSYPVYGHYQQNVTIDTNVLASIALSNQSTLLNCMQKLPRPIYS